MSVDASHRPPAPGVTASLGWLRWAVAIVVWLAAWQVGAGLIGHEVLLVSPWQVIVRLGQLLPSSTFWATAGYSLARIGLGFVLALGLGFGLAWLASLNPWVGALVDVPVRLVRSVPVVSIIILILLWANASWLSVTVSAMMVTPIVYANAAEALAARSVALQELACVFGLSRARRWWAITLPGLMSYLTAAARAGAGLAWKAGISAEVIGLPRGSVGERLYQAKLYLSSADLFAWTLVVVVLAAGCELLAVWLLGRLQVWLGRRYAR